VQERPIRICRRRGEEGRFSRWAHRDRVFVKGGKQVVIHPRQRIAGLAAVLLVVSAVVGACGTGPAASAGPIKIGFFAPETGFAAADGESAYDAAKLAVSDINAAGGVGGAQLTLVNYDDASDATQAVSIATKLVTQDAVTAVVSGSYSDQTLAAASIFQRNSVPMLAAYAVNPGIPATGNFIFQQDFNGVVEGAAAADALVKDLGSMKPAIVAIKNDFGSALVEGFTAEAQKLGATVVATDSNDFGEKDFTPILQRDMSMGADGVFMAQYYGEAQQFIANWNSLKLTLPLVGTEGVDSTTQFFEPVGAAANGMVFTTPFNRDSTDRVVVNFVKAFTDKYGHAPDMVAATTYDSFMVLKQAMQKGTSAQQIQAGIAGITNFVGATGTIQSYNSQGEVIKAVDLEIIRDGEVHHYGEVSDPAVITP
jgi:branched-chain amino acid transport system substrate-binding protein